MTIDPPIAGMITTTHRGRILVNLGLGQRSNRSAEESRRLIDRRKAELYESIRRLNSRRNELAPISALPPELLARIFTFLHPWTGTRYLTFDFTSAFNFTYVSQNWRNVALDTPSLWNTPDLLSPVCSRIMLDRSKMADLVVSCSTYRMTDYKGHDEGGSPLKEIFNKHASRIREIDLYELNPSFLSSILENLQPSSLRLRFLGLSSESGDEYGELALPKFPAHLLVQPSGLRSLVISRCAFDLYAHPHPQLTRLSVERSHPPLLTEFVAAISGMPALEILEMMHSLPLATKAVKLGLKVELPNLSFLHLVSTENFFEVLNVVDCLIVPWTTRVNLASTPTEQPRNTTAIQLAEIVPSLGPFFSCMTGKIERRSYNRLSLSHSWCGFVLAAWKTERLHGSIPPDSGLALPLNVMDHLNDRSGYIFNGLTTDLPELVLSLMIVDLNQLGSFLDETLRCVSALDVQTLSIDFDLGRDAIYTCFCQSTTLQTVELNSEVVVSEFLQALTHKPEGYEELESSYYSVSFPALRSLRFNHVSFGKVGELLDCLMERYERGAELEKLSICDCYIGDKDVWLLREIVLDVEWDGISRSEDDYEYGAYDSEDYEDTESEQSGFSY